MLIVIALIFLFAYFYHYASCKYIPGKNFATTIQKMIVLSKALEKYTQHYGMLPKTLGELEANGNSDKIQFVNIEDISHDGWSNKLTLVMKNSNTIEILSLGMNATTERQNINDKDDILLIVYYTNNTISTEWIGLKKYTSRLKNVRLATNIIEATK